MVGCRSPRASANGPSIARAGRLPTALALLAVTLGDLGPAMAQTWRVPRRATHEPLIAPPPAVAEPLPGAVPSLPTTAPPMPERPYLDVRSHLVTFGSVAAGEIEERPGALVVRVVSPRPWSLWLTCGGLQLEESGRRLPASRLAWRGSGSADYQPLRSGPPMLVARGPATGLAGEPVAIDLRLEVEDDDPMGRLRADLGLQLAH